MLGCVFAAAWATGCGGPQPPNVLVILVDALRADHLGIYGYEQPSSPHVDALARESLLFQHAHAQSPWTKPSVPTLFTSLYPIQHGVYEGEAHGSSGALESDVLADRLTTLAELFQQAGYRTVGFVNNAHLRGDQGFSQGFDVYDQGDLDAEEINRRFLEALEDAEEPLFAYLHYLDVHWPFQPPAEWLARFGSQAGGLFDRPSWRGLRDRINDGTVSVSEADRRDLVARHDAAIAELDQHLGTLIGALRKRGELDRTVVLLTSDHGEELFDHGRVGHGGTLYGEVIEIPMLLRLPGGASARLVDTPARVLDVAPTLLDAAGLSMPARFEGRSLLASSPGETPEIVAETRHKRTYRVSVRRGPWKYVRTYRAPKGAHASKKHSGHFAIAAGMRVKAKGVFEADGILYADKLRLKDAGDDDVEVSGPVEGLDPEGNVFAIHGFAIEAEALLTAEGSPLVASLEAGAWLKVEGKPGREGRLVADAFEVLPDNERETELEGIVSGVDEIDRDKVRLRIGPARIVVTVETRLRGFDLPEATPAAPPAGGDPFTPDRLRLAEGLQTEEALFHLGRDPAERTDVAADEPAQLDAMQSELSQWLARMSASSAPPAQRVSLDGETIDQLRELGYIE